MRLLGQDALGELLNRLRRGFHCSWMSACRRDEDGGYGAMQCEKKKKKKKEAAVSCVAARCGTRFGDRR